MKNNNEKYIFWREDSVNEYYRVVEVNNLIYHIRVYADYYDPCILHNNGCMPDMTVSKSIYYSYKCMKKNGTLLQNKFYEYKINVLNNLDEFSF